MEHLNPAAVLSVFLVGVLMGAAGLVGVMAALDWDRRRRFRRDLDRMREISNAPRGRRQM